MDLYLLENCPDIGLNYIELKDFEAWRMESMLDAFKNTDKTIILKFKKEDACVNKCEEE